MSGVGVQGCIAATLQTPSTCSHQSAGERGLVLHCPHAMLPCRTPSRTTTICTLHYCSALLHLHTHTCTYPAAWLGRTNHRYPCLKAPQAGASVLIHIISI